MLAYTAQVLNQKSVKQPTRPVGTPPTVHPTCLCVHYAYTMRTLCTILRDEEQLPETRVFPRHEL